VTIADRGLSAAPIRAQDFGAVKVILVAEHNELHGQLAAAALSGEGWPVRVIDGQLSIATLVEQDPAALVANGQLLGGWDAPAKFLEELRAVPELRAMPIVVWTGSMVSPADEAALVERFAPLVIVRKPELIPALADAIRTVLPAGGELPSGGLET
jgi:CheY-like chemotaxis protein